MRANHRRCAIVAATVLALCGCRSGGSSSGWSWGRKNHPTTSSTAGSNSGPILPSAQAAPANPPASSYASAPPSASSSPYPDAGGGSAPPAANYAGPQGGYAGASALGAAGNVAPPSAYGAGAAPPGAAPSVAPQVGPYNENIGQPAGGSYAAAPGGYGAPNSAAVQYPPGSVPSTAGGYQPGHGYQGAPDSYTNVPSGGNNGTPAENQPGGAQPPTGSAYAAGASPPGGAPADGGYQTADNRYGTDRYGASAPQGEQPPADRYANPADNVATADASAGSGYQPGATNYNPGQTGYNPPGVPPYQMPAQANVVQPSRRNPYYRPGGTGDYVPSGGTLSPAASTADRYSSPPQTGDPNAMPPAGGGIIVR